MLNALKQIARHWGRAGVGSHAAATAYYAIFSIAPLILIAITVAGLILGREAAQTAILDQFGSTFGGDFRGFAEGLVASREEEDANIIGAVIGGVLILLGASGIFSALREGLDEVFENLSKDKLGFLSGAVDQLISVGMVLSLGFLLLASLLVSTILTSMSGYLQTLLPGAQVAALLIDFVVT
jgi:membrane protein